MASNLSKRTDPVCASTSKIHIMPAVCSSVLVTVVFLALLGGCTLFGKDKPPAAAVDLRSEDFGTGISLLMPGISVSASSGGSMNIWKLAPEELTGRNPYEERPDGGSLLVAVVSDVTTGKGKRAKQLYDVVSQILIFPDPTDSRITLGQESLAGYNVKRLEEYLGVSALITESQDGLVHASFSLSADKTGDIQLSLTTSHYQSDGCYAFKLAVEQPVL